MQRPMLPHNNLDHCPYCNSDRLANVRSGEIVSNHLTHEHGVECEDCGRHYTIKFTATSVFLGDDKEEFCLPVTELVDVQDEEDYPHKTSIAAIPTADGLFIMAHGYGDFSSAFGYGCPIIIEQKEGILRVVTWEDINDENHSHIIALGDARHEAYAARNEDCEEIVAARYNRDGEEVERQQFDDLGDAIRFVNEAPIIPCWSWKVFQFNQATKIIYWTGSTVEAE